MLIVSKLVADLMPRENLISDIGRIIDDTQNSPDDIGPWMLADTILKFIEAKINRVADDGTVTYRARSGRPDNEARR